MANTVKNKGAQKKSAGKVVDLVKKDLVAKPVIHLPESKIDESSQEYQDLIKSAATRVFNKKKFNLKYNITEKKIRVIRINGNAWAEEKRLIGIGETFNVTRTNVTTKFTFPERNTAALIFSSKTFSYQELNLFVEIRKEVRFNIEQKKLLLPNYTSKDIGYYLFSNKIHMAKETGRVEFNDVMEFDIRKAYYMAAYKLKYISEEFYLRCIELPKTTRLRLIGSIATSKTTFCYKKGKMVGEPTKKEDIDLRKAWFNICKYVDTCMRELRQLMGEDFLFYWVDGIYCRNNPKIDQYLMYMNLKYHFDFEYRQVEKIVAEKDDKQKTIIVKAYRVGDDPEQPTKYFLNNDGEVIRELKDFYIKEFLS